ncbi:MAG: TIGR04283 family arsenosugar biosynthesis glycosyltransferase [Verrucomicrobia bacterium]|nr:TIGR04283 family arsenosugar biosynthesis glycosyltransferase [Verrucomicrobiota bacterium]
MISAIIVAYDEEAVIQSVIQDLKKQQFDGPYELLLADGGSTDNTVTLAQEEGISIVVSQKSKANQMNEAARTATGDILFFVHADMKLPENVFSVIQKQINDGFDGGGFSNVFDEHNDRIKNIGRWMNGRFFDKREQSDKGIFYGDNGIFVKKEVFEQLQGFKEIPIMEDYDFSKRMRKQFKVRKVRNPVITVSSRRHIQEGFIKTRFQWIMIRMLFNMRFSPFTLARWYKDSR